MVVTQRSGHGWPEYQPWQGWPAPLRLVHGTLADSYGVLGWWCGPLRFLELPIILAGPMRGCMCYCRVRRRSR